MKVTPFHCGPAANESELRALEHLKSGLQSATGDDEWVLLTNLAFSVTHQRPLAHQPAKPDADIAVAPGASTYAACKLLDMRLDQPYVGHSLGAVDSMASPTQTLRLVPAPMARASSQAAAQPPKLLDQVRAKIRALHYSIRTEEAYVGWIRRFILYHDKRHPREMGEPEINQFLTHLAVEGNVAASTQNQALAAILFLYQGVLERELNWIEGVVRAKKPERLPVVLTRDEVRAVLKHLDGTPKTVALLLYGAGLRLLDALRLRIKDIDFAMNQITA
jgi:hypothetical protein